MSDAGDDLQELTARLTRLEERVATWSPHSLTTGPAADDALPGGGPDHEPFWALAGLKTRMSGTSAVLFTGAVTLPTGAAYEWQQAAEAGAVLEGDWSLASDVLGALGHPVRLVMLREVLRGAQTVADLGSVEGLGTSGQLYHHLRQLVAAGWLRTAGRGRYVVPAARVVRLLVVIVAAQR